MNRMKRRKAVISILLVFSFLIHHTLVFGKQDESFRLLTAYRQNSVEYRSIASDIEESKVQYQIYKEKYDKLKKQEDSYQNVVLEAEDRDNLSKNTMEAWLSMQNYSFYEEKGDIILKKRQEKAEHTFLLKYYQLTVINSYLEYWKATKERCSYQLQLAKKRKKLGYGTNASVRQAKMELEEVEQNISDVQTQYQLIKKNVADESGVKNFVSASSIPVSYLVPMESEYLEDIKNDPEVQYLTWQLDAFMKYRDDLKEKLSDISTFSSYCDNQIHVLENRLESQKNKRIQEINEQYALLCKKDSTITQMKSKSTSITRAITKSKRQYKAGLKNKSDVLELQIQKRKNTYELYDKELSFLNAYYQLGIL